MSENRIWIKRNFLKVEIASKKTYFAYLPYGNPRAGYPSSPPLNLSNPTLQQRDHFSFAKVPLGRKNNILTPAAATGRSNSSVFGFGRTFRVHEIKTHQKPVPRDPSSNLQTRSQQHIIFCTHKMKKRNSKWPVRSSLQPKKKKTWTINIPGLCAKRDDSLVHR